MKNDSIQQKRISIIALSNRTYPYEIKQMHCYHVMLLKNLNLILKILYFKFGSYISFWLCFLFQCFLNAPHLEHVLHNKSEGCGGVKWDFDARSNHLNTKWISGKCEKVIVTGSSFCCCFAWLNTNTHLKMKETTFCR